LQQIGGYPLQRGMTAAQRTSYLSASRAILVAERAGDLVHDGSFCAVAQTDASFLVIRTGIQKMIGQRITPDGDYARIWTLLATRLLAKPRS
jgi:hypothetical protein